MEVLSYAGQPTIALHDKDIDPCKGAGLETYTSPATGASELTFCYIHLVASYNLANAGPGVQHVSARVPLFCLFPVSRAWLSQQGRDSRLCI